MLTSVLIAASIITLSDGFHISSVAIRNKYNLNTLVATATEVPTSAETGAWSPSSWKKFPIKQPPNYPDEVLC